jgi:hypothetical protein
VTYDVASTPAANVSNTAYAKSDEVNTAVNGTDTVDITRRSTTTSPTCGPSPSQVNSPIICTAVVTDTDAGSKSDPTGLVAFTTDGTGSFTAAAGYTFTGPNMCTLISDSNLLTFTSKCSVTYTTAVANVDNIGANYLGSTLHYPSPASTVMVVFYDPNAGFVTGGGYINSPVGAAPASPSAVGKANYGFVAKYQKNSTNPQGETEFQLKPANINFHSSTLDWLVVTNPTTSTQKAQYQGSGTNNGSGDYKFQVTVIDGGSTDYFRIKIWDRVSGVVLYDNMGTGTPGYPTAAPDGTNPTTLASGGNIVIHK